MLLLVMGKGRVIWLSVGAILIGFLIVLLPKQGGLLPPVVTVLSSEPDTNRPGMSWVTLSVSNQNTSPFQEFLFITSYPQNNEVRIANTWLPTLAAGLDCVLIPGDRVQQKFLVHEQANALRFRFAYRIGEATIKPTLWFRIRAWIIFHAGNFLPAKLSQWISPMPHNREIRLEIPIPPSSATIPKE